MSGKDRALKRSEMTRDQTGSRYIDDRPAVFRTICHALPERSFWNRGHPMILCARCIFIYPMILAGAIAGIPLISIMEPSSKVILAVIVLLILPAAVDGLTQYHGLRTSTNNIRAVTGALFGAGCGIALTYLVMRLMFNL